MPRTPEVRVRSADRAERRVPLRAKTSIGRAEDSDIYFPDQLLSRRHAEIELRADGPYIVDLESTNGTFLNGERLHREKKLRDGDVIAVGGNTLIFREVDTVEAERAARYYSLNELSARATRKTIDVTQLVKEDRVLGSLNRVTNALVGSSSLTDIYTKLLDCVLEVIPAERGAIMMLEGDPPAPRAKAARSRTGAVIDHVSSSIARKVVEGRMSLLLRDVFEDVSLRDQPSIIADPIRAAMCAPLWLGAIPGGAGTVLGFVYLDSHTRDPFTESDLQVLTVLANFAATKIESARLQQENMEKRRLEEEMGLAAEIQASLLPQGAPRVAGFDVAGVTRPSRTVGGDYYDFLLDGERLHVALGDVSGKGLGAAMLMVALRATVRAYWREDHLARAVAKMNEVFNQTVPFDKYATFFVGRLEVATGKLVYVNAGHNRPLLIRATGTVDVLAEGGTILGAFETGSWTEGTQHLLPGDTLLVFSDGVSDTWPEADLADRHLVEIIRAHDHLPAAALQVTIFEEIERQSGQRPQDDCTLLVVKRAKA
jgi:sigma-B regulation protein RsbU (phosphoserine phosphatase)